VSLYYKGVVNCDNVEEYTLLAQHFEQFRPKVVQSVSRHFPAIDQESIDMLYTDCWFTLMTINVNKVRKLRSYLETLLINKVKHLLRDSATSQDIFERFMREYGQEGDATNLISFLENLPDERENEAEAIEEICTRVQISLESIPRTIRLVGEWYYVDGITVRDIGIKLGFGKSQVFRMLIQFRVLLRKAYLYLLKLEESPKTT
jgi:DNA-directed RNA polymerase specialized sigma24 family protein